MGLFNRSGLPRGYMHLEFTKFGAIPMPDINWVTRNMSQIQQAQATGDLNALNLDPNVGRAVVDGIVSHFGLTGDLAAGFREESMMRFRWAFAIARSDPNHLGLQPPIVDANHDQAVRLRGLDSGQSLPAEVAYLFPSLTHAGLFVGRGGNQSEPLVLSAIRSIKV